MYRSKTDKKCCECQKIQNKEKHFNKRSDGYYESRCKKCSKHRLQIWAFNNPEKAKEAKRRNSALREALKSAEGACTEQQFYDKCEALGWECTYCTVQLTEETVTVDHIVPVSKGGSHKIDNLTPACLHCNQTKSSKLDRSLKYCIA